MSQNYPKNQTIAYELHGNCYLNITNRCTLRCRFCPKFNHKWDVQSYNLRLKQEPDSDQVIEAVGDPSRYQQVVFCGLGESTLRLLTLLRTAQSLKQHNANIRLNTDGLANLANGCDVTPLLKDLVDSVSISLNAHNSDRYNYHCRPRTSDSFDAVIDFVKRVKEHVPDVTLTAIEGLEGVDIKKCMNIARKLGVDYRNRVLDVVG